MLISLQSTIQSFYDDVAGALSRQAAEKMKKLYPGDSAPSTLGLKDAIKKAPAEALDTILAYACAELPSPPAMTAAVIGSFHLGIPHLHPFRPYTLPSIGVLKWGGCKSVLIDGNPAARISDVGLAPTCLSCTPFFQVITGSSSVFIGGSRAVRLPDVTRACGTSGIEIGKIAEGITKIGSELKKEAKKLARGELGKGTPKNLVEASQRQADIYAKAMKQLVGRDPCVPPCYGAMLPVFGSVDIGGLPLPESSKLIELATGPLTGLAKRLVPAIRDNGLVKKLGSVIAGTFRKGRLLNALPARLRRFTGHPVDVVAGSFVLDAVDAELPGAIPLRLARSYSSTWGSRPSPLGHGWSHSLDEAVWREPGQLVYRAHDGRELELPLVDRETFVPLHRLTIRPLPSGYQIETPDGLLRDFIHRTAIHAHLSKIHDRRGHRIDLEYEHSRLARAHAPDGREIFFHYHPGGHLAQIDLPDPDSDGLVPHIRYTYDGDDLVQITDAVGHITRYHNDNHKIIKETLPNGLRFHFEYDGRDTDAACTRTYGDGGIIDHSLIYDRPRRTTLVSNSCKEPSIIRYGAHGEPLSITDARGGVTHHEYDEHLRLTATIDPLGRTTRHQYDARGNLTRTLSPDGATLTIEYDRDLPLAATDAAGGRWRWSHDSNGRLVRRTDPLGRTTTFSHAAQTTTITHPDGRRERHTHDPAGRLTRIDLPDGRTLLKFYDRRGRLVRTDLPDGTTEHHALDLLDRPTRHTLPNGDTRHFTYDDLGCLVRVCDARSDLRCTYTGLRWLASVGDVNASPYILERDLEGRIVRIADATGTLLHTERDATGRPRITTDVRGRRRRERDLAGQLVAEIQGGQRTTYTRDLAGRVLTIDHPDLTRDEFTWRPDGALLTATRRAEGLTTTTRRELDACARILREWQDDRWVAVTHDLHDRITHLRSSSGADLRLRHDDRGLARIDLPGSNWSLTCERDRHGREVTRQLPGGVTCWWHRDPAGRPREHGVTGSRPPQIHRHRRYTWTDARLTGDTDLTARPRARTTTPVTCPKDQPLHHTLGRPKDQPLHHAHGGPLSLITCPKDHLVHDALGRPISAADTHWQWCGDLLVHTFTAASPATWVFAADEPLAHLGTSRHALLTDPTGHRTAFDELGQPATPPQGLPPISPRLDIFGRPHSADPALARVTAELTDLLEAPPVSPSALLRTLDEHPHTTDGPTHRP